MILTQNKILNEVKEGNIFIKPFKVSSLNPNSYNFRLGEELLEMEDDVLDANIVCKTIKIHIPKTGYTLQPHKVYLGHTHESFGSDRYVLSLIGRSSLGRLGLFLQITADLGHIGTNHKWTLELTVVQPLVVYPRMKIGQISFWKPVGLRFLKGEKYKNKKNSYAGYSGPQESIPEKFGIEL